MPTQETATNLNIEKNLCFHAKSDGLPIYYDIYMPPQVQSGALYSHLVATHTTIIQIAHGMVEHKERYEWLCSHLANHGYIVAINDHRGHGKSIDESHPWGEMGAVERDQIHDGFHKAIEDLYTLTQILQQRFPAHRVILLGHSMGSLLSRGYLKRHGEVLHALILSGSPAYNPLLPFGIALAKLLQSIKIDGKHLINSLSFGGFNKPFATPNSESPHSTGECAWLSRDKESVRAYCADAACQFVFSLNSFIALFRGTLWVQKPLDETSALARSDALKPPILMISGASDSCGNFGSGVTRIADSLQRAGFAMTMQLYPEARHEIFQEINKQEVLRDVLLWIHRVS